MPLNDFYCETCGYSVELLHKMGEEPDESCPRCELPLKRKISVPQYRFLGEGWPTHDSKGYFHADPVQANRNARKARS